MTPFDSSDDLNQTRSLSESRHVLLAEPEIARAIPIRDSEPNSEGALPSTAAHSQPSLVRPLEVRRLEGAKELAKPLSPAHIQVVERWQGVVEEIIDDIFIARLVSTGGVASLPEEVGDFPMSLVSPDDIALVKEGALFTYTVARETRAGTRRSISMLSFRRMPMWHLRQITEAKIQGEIRAALLTERARDGDQQSFAAAGS
jgi:hypothetical protein